MENVGRLVRTFGTRVSETRVRSTELLVRAALLTSSKSCSEPRKILQFILQSWMQSGLCYGSVWDLMIRIHGCCFMRRPMTRLLATLFLLWETQFPKLPVTVTSRASSLLWKCSEPIASLRTMHRAGWTNIFFLSLCSNVLYLTFLIF